MSKYATLIAQIAANIRRNGAQAITGDLLQEQLLAMITSLGEYYQFGGLASPSAEFTPGDEPVVFVAATPGTYTNFGGLVVADGEVALLVWSGSAWSRQTTDIATRSEVSQLGQQVSEIENSVGHSIPDEEETFWPTIGGDNGGENLFYPTLKTILPPRTCIGALSESVWDTKPLGSSSFYCFYIPCKENTTYTVSNCSLDIAFFDRLKYKISAIEGEWQSQNTFTTPSGCCYFSIITNARKIDLVIVEGSTIPQNVRPLVKYSNAEIGHQDKFTKLATLLENNFTIPGNLFSPNNTTIVGDGMIFGTDSVNVNDRKQATSLSFYSFVIPVIPGKTYTTSMSGIAILYFDRFGNTIGYNTTSDYNALTFVAPANCYFVGINSNILKNVMMVVEGDTLPSNYQTYKMDFLGNFGKTIKLTEDISTPIGISDADNFFIDGSGYCIDLGEHLTGEKVGNYVEIAYTAVSSNRIYKVCVTKELPPLADSSTLSVGYNTTLWAHYTDATKDFKLLPVVSMEELAQNQNSFYYDGTKIYINIEEEAVEYVLANDKTSNIGLSISNSKGKIVNLTIKYSNLENCRVTNGALCEFTNCRFLYSSIMSSIVAAQKSTVILNRCEAFKARFDGMDTDADGTVSTMIQNDCHCHYCYDDGSSHHNGKFFINGGEYDHNHKGGISAPCYLSEGNISGAYIHNNELNGVYAVNTQEQGTGKFIISNCLFKGNGRNYSLKYYDCISFNNIYADTPPNTNHLDHATLTEYNQ